MRSSEFPMKSQKQQLQLQQFWGVAVFSLGVLWGAANLVYFPIAAITSVAGSSWFEGIIILAGGLLTFCASIGAFYRRLFAAWILLLGGATLVIAAGVGQSILQSTRGAVNLLLLFLSGSVAICLGLFGSIAEYKKWPVLREDL